MKLFSNFEISQENYFNFLLALIPISFIAGNTIININVILIIFSGLFFFYKDLFKLKYFFLDKILFLYFLLILLIGIYNDIFLYLNFNEFSTFRGGFTTSIKSFLFLRFLLFYLFIRILIEKNILNLKLFFIVSTFSSLFVCFDIFYQLIFGKDIFGYEINSSIRKLSGPFGDEYIAGGYIQRFSLFAFFLLPIFYFSKSSTKLNLFLLPLIFFIFLAGLIFSGNRMPFLLFLLTIILFLFFEMKNKKFFFLLIAISYITFSIIYNSNTNVQNNFENFNKSIKIIINNFGNRPTNYSKWPYVNEFSSAYYTWSINKSFGGGVKNFNFYCHKSKEKFDLKIKCNSHPHNYYLEILTETGIFGFIIISFLFMRVIYLVLYEKYFSLKKLNNNKIIIPFLILFITEIFPLRSSGSFFTTANASYFFLVLAILVALFIKDKSIENKI